MILFFIRFRVSWLTYFIMFLIFLRFFCLRFLRLIGISLTIFVSLNMVASVTKTII
ncbi:Uncharacterised protein [Mycobacterium tuberculosis]|nr:Uncharacterised protein [Mycobacterium tuberculosis]